MPAEEDIGELEKLLIKCDLEEFDDKLLQDT